MTTKTIAAPHSGLAGRRLLVLGGSSGIGLATAAAAVDAGAAVTLLARDAARLDAAARALRARRAGADVDVRAADIGDGDALGRALDQTPDIAHVLLAAGGAVLGGALDDTPGDPLAAVDLRLRSAHTVVRRVAPRLPADGSLVLTGGLSTERPSRGAWAIAVATAATEQLARALALELAPLRVNAISPGWTDTPMWDALLGAAKADVFHGVASRTPIGRLVAPEEVASAVLFLMSNRAMTGEVLHVDGGQRLT